MGMDSGYADVNGLHLYYEIHGDGGTPLVLLHGGVMTIELTTSRCFRRWRSVTG